MIQTFNFIFWAYRDNELKEKLLNALDSEENLNFKISHYILFFNAIRQYVRIFYDEPNPKFFAVEISYYSFRKMLNNQWDDGDIGYINLETGKTVGDYRIELPPDPDCKVFTGLYCGGPNTEATPEKYDYVHIAEYCRIINRKTETLNKENIEMFTVDENHSPKIMLALLVAEKAHEGQTDKAGVDYIEHPIKVASLVEGESEKVCALLHDVMEDTEFPESALRILFGDEIVDTLLLLTHRDGESYEEYIEKISKSELATKVKIADLTHNSDLTRLKTVTDKDIQRYNKYQKSIDFLKSKL